MNTPENRKNEIEHLLRNTEEKSRRLDLIVCGIFWFLYGVFVGIVIARYWRS